MKIIEQPDPSEFYDRPLAVIYPYIAQDDSTIIDDADDEWYGEEMGYVAAHAHHIELNYGWDDLPWWNVDQAEQFALAILKAVEIARQFTPRCARCGEPIPDGHERGYEMATGKQYHASCTPTKAVGS